MSARQSATSTSTEISTASSSTLVCTASKEGFPRLLYRGALSLPDSHLLLDGLTFAIQLPADDPQASLKLLKTPLPLALESMRGRPSLRFVSVEKMEDLPCDFSEDVKLHVHPRCILTYQLFAHNLCANPITSPSGRTELGIRIRLGDLDANTSMSNPRASASSSPLSVNASDIDIIVYGRAHPSSSVLQLCVARIIPPPPPASLQKAIAKLRPPRPDDPIPRRPPLNAGITRVGIGMKRKISRIELEADEAASGGMSNKKTRKDEDRSSLTAKMTNESTHDLKENRGGTRSSDAVFKVPPLPQRKKAPDKQARGSMREVDLTTVHEKATTERETNNKLIIKKSIVRLMTAADIGKQHRDFKDFYGYVYRGTCYALRSSLQKKSFDKDASYVRRIDRIVLSHISMYLEEDTEIVD